MQVPNGTNIEFQSPEGLPSVKDISYELEEVTNASIVSEETRRARRALLSVISVVGAATLYGNRPIRVHPLDVSVAPTDFIFCALTIATVLYLGMTWLIHRDNDLLRAEILDFRKLGRYRYNWIGNKFRAERSLKFLKEWLERVDALPDPKDAPTFNDVVTRLAAELPATILQRNEVRQYLERNIDFSNLPGRQQASARLRSLGEDWQGKLEHYIEEVEQLIVTFKISERVEESFSVRHFWEHHAPWILALAVFVFYLVRFWVLPWFQPESPPPSAYIPWP